MQTAELQHAREVEDHCWWCRERRSIIVAELRRIGSPGRAIDIGAEGGADTRVLAAHGWRATAVDASETRVELSRSRGLDACRCDPARLLLPSQAFDFALALNVLDRAEDDRAVAAEITRVLRPGGSALVSVPGLPCPPYGDTCCERERERRPRPDGVLRGYTRRTLAEVLEEAGLSVDRVANWNVLLRPLMTRRTDRALGRALGRGPGRAADRALRAVVAAERYLSTDGLPGMTLLARAHRR